MNSSFFHRNILNLTVFFIMVVVLTVNLNQGLWKKPNRIIQDDVILYYQYLPAVFIFKDLGLTDFINARDTGEVRVWVQDAGNGKGINKMTMGMAMMYSPFFLTAHALANPLGYKANGYSPPYKFMLIVASMCYLALGLFLLKKVLSKYYNGMIVAIALLVTALGTNLFFYSVANPALSHVFSFFLFSLFLWLLNRWLDRPTISKALTIGLTTGLIILVRPTNGIIVMLFFLWETGSWKMLKERVAFLASRWEEILLMALSAFIVLIPQFIYWKYITGSYLYYSYGDEGFFFSNPQFLKGLFSYKKGWLIYTPVMWFAMAGLPILFFRNRKLFWPILIFLIVNSYIIFSWWCWFGGGCFGMRFMIESYALLAFSLAAFIKWIYEKRWPVIALVSVMILFCIFLNLFQTAQYRMGSLSPSGMTKEAYWANFLKLKPTGHFYNTIKEYDYNKALKGVYEELPSLLESKDDYLLNTINYMKSDSSWTRQLEEKAKIRGISLDSMMYRDALWLWEQSQKDQK